MSKRLQVLLDDAEYRDLRKAARKQGLTVSEWVRSAIRAIRRQQPTHDTARKLAAVREAMQYSFPTADIEQMNEEIEAGYIGGNE